MFLVEQKNRRPCGGGSLPNVNADSNALLLDIDGTIIDIAPTPDAVSVPDSLKLHLSRIQVRLSGALALVSGRSIAAIDVLFAPLRFCAIGCHGAEIRRGAAQAIETEGPAISSSAKARFAEIGSLDPRIRIEDKYFTLAIHYRLVPELENIIFGMVHERLAMSNEDLRVLCGKDVIEIETGDFSKGTGLRKLMEHAPFNGRRPIYLGDDTTDEYAFAVLPEFGGIGVSVGLMLPGAQACSQTPSDVRRWLAEIAEPS